jgi:hypothetical protein
MNRQLILVSFFLFVTAFPACAITVTTEPAGAEVWVSTPVSPVLYLQGRTPCTLDSSRWQNLNLRHQKSNRFPKFIYLTQPIPAKLCGQLQLVILGNIRSVIYR